MDKDKTPIYEIYVMELPWHLDSDKLPSCGHRERVGFYYEKDAAIRAVEENWCDLQNHYAQAAEVCKIEPGLYSNPSRREYWYFLWNQEEEKFELARKPKLGIWEAES